MDAHKEFSILRIDHIRDKETLYSDCLMKYFRSLFELRILEASVVGIKNKFSNIDGNLDMLFSSFISSKQQFWK